MKETMKPLGKREAAFAAEHHDIVLRFLAENALSEDDYYDTVVFGFLNAVQKYLRHPEYQSDPFGQFADKYMAREVKTKQQEESLVLLYSLSEQIDGGKTLEERIADTKNEIDEALDSLDWERTVAVLNAEERRIVTLLTEGYEQEEVAQVLGVTPFVLKKCLGEIRCTLSGSLAAA